jgi:hypothetical protein
MIVIENAVNPESSASGLLHDAGDNSNAFDSQFLPTLIRRRKQNLDADRTTDRGTDAAQDQCPVQCYIACEAAASSLSTVIPVEDDRELKFVADCSSSLQAALKNGSGPHSCFSIG